jgi:hypothetical protein
MKFFDIIAGKVTLNPDCLVYEPFKTIYNTNEDKAMAEKYIEYIVFMNKPSSRYVQAYPIADRVSRVKLDVFGDSKYELPKEMPKWEQKFIELSETPASRLLKAVRFKLEHVISYLNDKTQTTLDDSQALKVASLFEKVGKIVKSLDDIERQVASEQISTTKIRGDYELGMYELPKNKL